MTNEQKAKEKADRKFNKRMNPIKWNEIYEYYLKKLSKH